MKLRRIDILIYGAVVFAGYLSYVVFTRGVSDPWIRGARTERMTNAMSTTGYLIVAIGGIIVVFGIGSVIWFYFFSNTPL